MELEGVDGFIGVTRESGGTLQADGFPGTIRKENPLVKASALQRGRLSQRVRGIALPTPGVTCSCAMPTTRRGMGDMSCAVCGGEIA